jgi:hypothetical protein
MKSVRPKPGKSFTLTIGSETIVIHNHGRGQASLAIEASHRVSINKDSKRKFVKRFF